jgi:hypothetical protein
MSKEFALILQYYAVVFMDAKTNKELERVNGENPAELSSVAEKYENWIVRVVEPQCFLRNGIEVFLTVWIEEDPTVADDHNR